MVSGFRPNPKISCCICRLGDAFQGRLGIPLVEVKRRRHIKGDYTLEGVKEVDPNFLTSFRIS